MIVGVVGLGKARGVTTLATVTGWLSAKRAGSNNGSGFGQVALAELDPAGGDMAGWWAVSSRGASSLAGNLRARVPLAQALRNAAATGPGGLNVVATNAVGLSVDAANRALRSVEGDDRVLMVVDMGRWNDKERSCERVLLADKLVAIVPSEPAGIARARSSLNWLGELRDGVFVTQRKGGLYNSKATAEEIGGTVLELANDPKSARAARERIESLDAKKRSELIRSVDGLMEVMELV